MKSTAPTDNTIYEAVGREALAPLLEAYARWLHEKATRDGVTALLFLARDGYLMQRAYKTVIPEHEQIHNKFMYASRRLFNLAAIRSMDDAALKFLLGDRVVMSVSEYLQRAGLDADNYSEQIKAAGFDGPHDLVQPYLQGALRDMFVALEKPVVSVAAAERSRLKAYADSLVDWDLERCGIVDVGWHGSLQKSLGGVLGFEPADVFGYYLGLHYGSHQGSVGVRRAFLDESRPADFVLYQKTIRRCVEIFELCFSEPAGSIYGLTETPDGQFEALRHETGLSSEATAGLAALQEAAVAALARLEDAAPIDRHTAMAGMARFMSRPTSAEARCFGEIVHQEGFGGQGRLQRLAAPRYDLNGYVRRPLTFVRDLRRTFWRRGFTARL